MGFIIFKTLGQMFPRWLVAVPLRSCGGTGELLTTWLLLFCGGECSECECATRRFSDAVRITVLSKVFCEACSTFSLLLYPPTLPDQLGRLIVDHWIVS